MQIIGHRGAAGLALENTISSLRAGILAGVDALEFDIRVTSDNEMVLIHDATLERIYKDSRKVSSLTKKDIPRIKTAGGQILPCLAQALEVTRKLPVIIEGKNSNWAKPLAKYLKSHPYKKFCTVISFNHQELQEFGRLCPDVPLYVLEHRNSFDAINAARLYKFTGVDLNYWTLNPLSYWLARRHNLEIIVYTVNKPWIASFLKLLYPKIRITTDVPNRLQFVRPKYLRNKSKGA